MKKLIQTVSFAVFALLVNQVDAQTEVQTQPEVKSQTEVQPQSQVKPGTKQSVEMKVRRFGLVAGLGISKGRFVNSEFEEFNNSMKSLTTGSAMFFGKAVVQKILLPR